MTRLVIAPELDRRRGDVASRRSARCAERSPADASRSSRAGDPAAIYRAEGSADEVSRGPRFAADALAARRGRFDEAWLLPNSIRAALLARASGARRTASATPRSGAAGC